MDPNLDQTQHHTRLYIILSVMVAFAVIFFLLRPSSEQETPVIVTEPPPPQFQKVTLTPAQAKAKEEFLKDPALTKTRKLTPAEIKAKEAFLKGAATMSEQ